jgi:hypothetical protein
MRVTRWRAFGIWQDQSKGEKRTMSIQFHTISTQQYEAFYRRHYEELRHRSPFHHPAWLNASAAGVGFKQVFIGLFAEGELTAVIPGYVTRKGPFRLFGSPMRGVMTSYLGPTGVGLEPTPHRLAEIVEGCNAFVRRKWRVSYARFTLRNAPGEDKLPLGDDWKQQRAGSYRLDISRGEDEVWKGLKSDCRRNIRKARKAGIEIAPLRDSKLFFQMLDETLRRHQTTSFQSGEFFDLIMDQLVRADRMWALRAIYKGEDIAVGLFLHDDKEVHYISGASSPKFGNLPTSYLLHWHAIESGMREGLQIFNSDASRVRSIDRFKESFSPQLEKRFTLIWAPAYVYKLQKRLISLYHNLRRVKSWLKPTPSEAGGGG